MAEHTHSRGSTWGCQENSPSSLSPDMLASGYRPAVQQQEPTPPKCQHQDREVITQKLSSSSGKVEDRALALPLCNYSVSFIHATRPAFLRKLRTAAQANRPQCRSSVIAQQLCPALSSPSVSSSHVKTTQEHWLSVLVFLAVFLNIKEIVYFSKHSPKDFKLGR